MSEEEKKEEQGTLFGNLDQFEWWKQEWKGMPEFVQKELKEHRKIIVRFENQEEVDNFAKLIGQNVTLQTKSIWYPEIDIAHFMDKRYVDKSAIESEEETFECIGCGEKKKRRDACDNNIVVCKNCCQCCSNETGI